MAKKGDNVFLEELMQRYLQESALKPQWKCIDSYIHNVCLHYGRFILFPLPKGQAECIGITMRKALLLETKVTAVRRVKFKNVNIPSEYGNIEGIFENVHQILSNFSNVVLRGFTDKVIKASIRVRANNPDPIVVAHHIENLPPTLKIVDKYGYLFCTKENKDFSIELTIERSRFSDFQKESIDKSQNKDGSYFVENIPMPVINANYTIHKFGNGNKDAEILFFEIWTNGSLTPKEAIRDASMNLIGLFSHFLHPEEEDVNIDLTRNQETCNLPVFLLSYEKTLKEIVARYESFLDFTETELLKRKKTQGKVRIPWDSLFVDQLHFSLETSSLIEKAGITTIQDLFVEFSSNNCKNIFHLNMEALLEIATRLIALNEILRSCSRYK